MRVLLASTAGAGHVGPLIPFADTWLQQGVEVEFVVPPGAEHLVQGRGYLVTSGVAPPATEMELLWERFAAADKVQQREIAEREAFASRGTQAMLSAIAETVERRRPDLIVREPCDYASAIVALEREIPCVTAAISFSVAEWSVIDFVGDILDTYGSRVRPGIEAPFLTRFPLSLDPSPFPDTRRYRVTPTVPIDNPRCDPWASESDRLLYVTLGSLVGARSDAREVFSTMLDAASGLDADVVLTVGHAFDLSMLQSIPANVRVASWIPQDEILAHCDAVICHGGSGTTYGALAYGLPLGFVPLFADQPANASAVAGVGAGLVLETTLGESRLPLIDRSLAPAIRAMAEELLRDPSYREAARHLADEMGAQPDVSVMANSLIDWAVASPTWRRRV